jgi:hypothetical protein
MNRELHIESLAFVESAPSDFSEEEWSIVSVEEVTVDAQSEAIRSELADATPGRFTLHHNLVDVMYESKMAYSDRLG